MKGFIALLFVMSAICSVAGLALLIMGFWLLSGPPGAVGLADMMPALTVLLAPCLMAIGGLIGYACWRWLGNVADHDSAPPLVG